MDAANRYFRDEYYIAPPPALVDLRQVPISSSRLNPEVHCQLDASSHLIPHPPSIRQDFHRLPIFEFAPVVRKVAKQNLFSAYNPLRSLKRWP